MKRYFDLEVILGSIFVILVVLFFTWSIYLWGSGTTACEKNYMRYHGYINGELYCVADDGRMVLMP